MPMHSSNRKSWWKKTRKININDVKPVSAITATDNALQEFRQSMLKKEHTHPYALW